MLIIFGDTATLSQDDFYNRWLDYCHSHNAYKSAWEFMK